MRKSQNAKMVACVLLKSSYKKCIDNIELLGKQEVLEELIIPKVDFNKTDNDDPVSSNLKDYPFSEYQSILDLSINGILSGADIQKYTEIMDKYIKDDVVIIKINKSYYPGISALELYDVTRGCWRRRIESVESAKYALAAYKGEVVEVYKIDYWCHASELNRKTIAYNHERHWNRIGFIGSVADEKVREQ